MKINKDKAAKRRIVIKSIEHVASECLPLIMAGLMKNIKPGLV